MSLLKEIMSSRGLTSQDLARKTGLTYQTIWRLLKNDSYEFAQKETQRLIATALGVTVRDIIYGKDPDTKSEEEKADMRKKIAEAEIKKGVEHIINALNKYSAGPMYLSLSIFTKDNTCKCDEDPDGIPDYYSLRAHTMDTDYEEDADRIRVVPMEMIVNETARVYYGEDGIRQVIPFER